jgi:hypothetical protein
MLTAKKYGLLLASTLLAAAPISASSIDSFSFTPVEGSPFASSLTESLSPSGTEASVTGTVSCESDSPCTGELATFAAEVDLTGLADTLASIDISGDLSGDTAGGGELFLTSPISNSYPFVIPSGAFDKPILSTEFPPVGLIEVAGSLDLTLAPGQEVSLPISFTLGSTTAVPEPSGQAMLVLGLLGLVGVVRYRSLRAH